MSGPWKPGAIVVGTAHGTPGVVMFATTNKNEWALGQRVTRGQSELSTGFASPSDVADVRPLVLIDPEDIEAVRRLIKCLPFYAYEGTPMQMQAALREFANPTPAKPEEPTGLGAVVEDQDGRDWHRTRDGRWVRADGLSSSSGSWLHVDAVKVLSEGMQS